MGSWQGADVIAVESTDPLAVEALAVRAEGTLHALIASLLPTSQRCRIEGLPPGDVTDRVLGERTFAAACSDPAAFRAGFEPVVVGRPIELELAPYAVVRLDVCV